MESLEAHYNLHEQNWDSYDELRNTFEWYVPDSFNAGRFLCDRWADRDVGAAIMYEDRTADAVGTVTFEQLRNRTNELANLLEERGLEKGDRIGVNVRRKREALFAYVAAWKAGLVPVPVSTLFGPDGIEYRLADSGARACIVDESNLADYREAIADIDGGIEHTLVVGDATLEGTEVDFWDALADASPTYSPVETRSEDDLILIYTSGTTGDPKGVRHAHRAVIGHLPGAITNGLNLEVRSDDVCWTPVEFSWAGSVTAIIRAWAFGIPLVAFESGESFDPDVAFSVLERYDVTVASVPASALRMMRDVNNPGETYDLDDLRLLLSGGESLGESIREWARSTFGVPINEVYGQSEIWNMIAGDCTALTEPRPGWFGRPLPGHDLSIVDPETAEPLPDGEVGEIAVDRSAPTVLKEYWNEPERTAEKFSGDLVLTGDLGKRGADGRFKFVSRKDDVIISSGYRIGPAEVEDSIASHEAVVDAGVVGVPDDERGTVPKAFVVLADDRRANEALESELRTYVRENLAAHEYPRYIEFVDELPRTTTGKIKRSALVDEDS